MMRVPSQCFQFSCGKSSYSICPAVWLIINTLLCTILSWWTTVTTASITTHQSSLWEERKARWGNIYEEISYLSVIHLQVCHHYPYHQVVLLNLCDIYVGIGPIRHICATKIKSLHLSLQIKLLHLRYQGFTNSRWYLLYKSLPMERLGGHR